MSNGFNPEFDHDIEQRIRLKAITGIPSFKPQISIEELNELGPMTPRDQQIVTIMLKAFSKVGQKQDWQMIRIIEHNASIREIQLAEVRRLDAEVADAANRKLTLRSALIWLLQNAVGAILAGTAAAYAMWKFKVL
jgi:hypothetical protein